MELTLNVGWALLAALMVCLWLRYRPREGESRRTQLIALAVLLAILFPVISVSDDLQSLNNPAEVDTSVRRDQVVLSVHSVLPTVVALIRPVIVEVSFGAPRFIVPGEPPLRVVDYPCLAAIDNRPPPAA